MELLNLRPAQLKKLSEDVETNDAVLVEFLSALRNVLVNHPMDRGANSDAIYMLGIKLSDYEVLQHIGAARLVANLDLSDEGTSSVFLHGLPHEFADDVRHELTIRHRTEEAAAAEKAEVEPLKYRMAKSIVDEARDVLISAHSMVFGKRAPHTVVKSRIHRAKQRQGRINRGSKREVFSAGHEAGIEQAFQAIHQVIAAKNLEIDERSE